MTIRERVPISPEDLTEDRVSPLFRSAVDRGFKYANGSLIENHNTADGLYLFRKILAFAKDKKLSVTLFSGTLREDFYNCLTDELNALVAKGLNVHAYVTEACLKDVMGTDTENRFAKILLEREGKDSDSYRLKALNRKIERTLEDGTVILQEIPHVIYAGEGEAFRWETNSDTHEAIAAFGPKDAPLGRYLLPKIMRGIPNESGLRWTG